MKQTPYYYHLVPCDSFGELCGHFPTWQMQSPFRSTVPLLSMVGQTRPEWERLLDQLSVPLDAPHHFEYEVPSPKPGGNPSQTDLMLLPCNRALAIEVKWTEQQDKKTVRERIKVPENDGADPRRTIEGWLDHLRPFAKNEISVNGCLDVVYQLLHRAASACALANSRGTVPELLYLHFAPSPLPTSATTARYEADLALLHSILGKPAGFKFSVLEVPLTYLPSFQAIKNLDKRSPLSAERVVQALCGEPLFAFGSPILKTI